MSKNNKKEDKRKKEMEELFERKVMRATIGIEKEKIEEKSLNLTDEEAKSIIDSQKIMYQEYYKYSM